MRPPPFHVHVDVTGVWSYPAPGVLLAWRQTDRGEWEAYVMWASAHSTGNGDEVTVRQSWVPAHLVRPAVG
jgi:hypothetical protein